MNENPPGFPVAEHAWDGLDDMEVRCVEQCKGTNNVGRREEMRLIFNLGTLRTHRLNVYFTF